MQRRSLIRAGAAGLGSAVLGRSVYAQQYPNGTVTVVLPLQAGSASDVAIRHLSERLALSLKSGVVVENIAAAAGVGVLRNPRANGTRAWRCRGGNAAAY